MTCLFSGDDWPRGRVRAVSEGGSDQQLGGTLSPTGLTFTPHTIKRAGFMLRSSASLLGCPVGPAAFGLFLILTALPAPISAQTLTLNEGTIEVKNGGVWDLKGTRADLGAAESTASIAERGGGRFTGGELTATRILNSPSDADPAGLRIEISASEDLGEVAITRGHRVQTLQNGNESIGRFYEVNPSQNNRGLDAELAFSYSDAELGGLSESNLELFKSTDGGDTWNEKGFASRDPQANTVSVSGVESLSRWTLGIGRRSVRLDLAEGWNLLSIPLQAQNQAFGAVLPACESGFVFVPGQGYQSIPADRELPVGKGFWGKCRSDTVEVKGQVPDSVTASVGAGWNIVGPGPDTTGASQVTSQPPGIIQSSFFGFAPGQGYESASRLKPGDGYWVKANQSGTVYLSGGKAAGKSAFATAKAPRAEGPRLIVTDAEGRSAVLRFAEGLTEEELTRFELPPVPPKGLFDVRFESGRKVASARSGEKGLHAVKMQGLRFPVKLRREATKAGPPIRVLRAPGQTIRLTAENPSATLQTKADRLQVGVGGAPKEFALKKPYPNPVHGEATLRYVVSKETNVTIEVYNVLGRQVARLVDGARRPGRHQVQLGSSLPSGTYFVRMRAGSFTETQRVTVVR